MSRREDIQNERFGHVRSLLQNGPSDDEGTAWWQTLLSLLETEAVMDPRTYDEVWLPYLQGFPHHWAHVQRVTNLEELAHLTRLLPKAVRFEARLTRPFQRPSALFDLLDTPHTPRIVSLYVHNLDLGPHGAQRLANINALGGLTRLHLAQTQLTDAGLAHLTNSKHLTNLTHLDLTQNALSNLKGISRAPWHDLRHLKLNENWLEAPAAQELAQAHMPRLDSLHMRLDSSAVGSLSALHRAPWARTISDLRISLSGLGARGCAAALRHLQGARLTQLDLIQCRDGLIEALTQHPPRGLDTLRLWFCSLRDQDIKRLAQSEHLEHMSLKLDLSHNDLGDAAAFALAKSPYVGNLRALWCTNNEISIAGARAMLESPHFESLEALGMSSTQSTTDERALLASTSPRGHLLR